MSSVRDRLLEFIEKKGLNPASFEKKVGLSNAYVKNIRKSIGDKSITKIKNEFPDLNVDWLLTGNGDMIKSSTNNTINNPKEEPEMYKQLIDEIYELKERCARYERIIDDMTMRRNEELNKQTGT
nr:hypothetical protein [uncultured Draconibacterium sp.]